MTTATAAAERSVFSPAIAGIPPQLRDTPPRRAKGEKPTRVSRKKVLAMVPKILSSSHDLRGTAARADLGPIATQPAEADAAADEALAPEVPWADDRAPSGLPTLGDTQEGFEVAVKLAVLMRTRMLITASSGAGKSWAVRRLLEQTAPLVQQIVIDPEGEFETLKEKFPYAIFSDRDPRLPLSRCSPFALAQELVKSGISAVLDLSEFETEDKHYFVARFIKGLMSLQQEYWRHVMVVLDEAHLFAPQQDKSVAKKQVIDLAGRGRKRGFCPVLATQRFSMLNKSVAAELQNRLIGQTILDRDLRRAADELGMPFRLAVSALTNLEPGNFFVYGPALTRTVQRMKVGPVLTTHGVQLGEMKPPTPPSADAMNAIYDRIEKKDEDAQAIQAIAAGAAQKAAETNDLRQEIAGWRARTLTTILETETAEDRAEAIRHAAHEHGVTVAAIYQWIAKFDSNNPVESMLPRRLPANARRPSDAPPPAKPKKADCKRASKTPSARQTKSTKPAKRTAVRAQPKRATARTATKPRAGGRKAAPRKVAKKSARAVKTTRTARAR